MFTWQSTAAPGIYAYTIDSNGALTRVPGSPYKAKPKYFVAVDPTGKFAYFVNSTTHNMSGYSIGAGGSLTALSGSPFKAGLNPLSIAISPSFLRIENVDNKAFYV